VSSPRLPPPLDRTRVLAARAGREFLDDGCLQRAAAIAYYAVLALFPLAILAVAAFGLVLDDQDVRRRIIGFVLDNVPLREERGRRDLEAALTDVTRQVSGFGALGAAGLVLSASALMGAVRHALNAAWDVGEERPFLRGKLVDVALVLGTGAVLAAALAAGLVAQLVSSLGGGLVVAGRATSFGLDVLVLLVLFHAVPACRPRVRDVWPGALVGAAGFELAKLVFGWYLRTMADYSAVYASLGGIVALLVFIYVAAAVMLLGAEVAAEHARLGSTHGSGVEPARPAPAGERADQRGDRSAVMPARGQQ
jgi:membrane protein